MFARDEAGLFEYREIFGGCAEVVNFEFVEEKWHGHGAVWLEGTAVVEDDGGAGSEAGDEPMPHHPGAGREIEEAVTWFDVAMEEVFLSVLEKGAEGAVDDGLGGACCARGVKDIDWMVWW